MTVKTASVEEWVQFYHGKGFSIIPVKHKDKKPNIASWKEYAERRPTDDEINLWLKKEIFENVGIICGEVSNNLVVLDLDNKDIVSDLNLDLNKLMYEKGVWVQVTGRDGHYHVRTEMISILFTFPFLEIQRSAANSFFPSE